jgi:hypothetical protein
MHAGDRRTEIGEQRTQLTRFPLSSLPSKNQQSSFDIRSNHWNPTVGRTGPVSPGSRLRRPTRLRGAASPYRSWMTSRFKSNPTKSCFVPRHLDRGSECRDRRTEVEVRNSPAFRSHLFHSKIHNPHSDRTPAERVHHHRRCFALIQKPGGTLFGSSIVFTASGFALIQKPGGTL